MLYYVVFGTDNYTAPGYQVTSATHLPDCPLVSIRLLCYAVMELCPSITCRSTDSFDDDILPFISPLGYN